MVIIFIAFILSISAYADDKFEFSDLAEMMSNENRPLIIEDFLAQLPKEMNSLYALIHTSQSLQKASPQSPRPLLFNQDASLMMAYQSEHFTYNGDPQSDPFDKIEVIRWIEKESRYELYEISFNTNNGAQSVSISSANPAICLSCHGEDPRPIWDEYPVWQNAFGGNADFERGRELYPGEREQVDSFVEGAANNPRLSNLLNLREGFELLNNENGRTGLRFAHNLALTHRIFHQNFERITRLIRETPNIEQFRYALLGSIQCRDRFMEFFPSSVWELLNSGPYTSEVTSVPFGRSHEGVTSERRIEDGIKFIFDNRGINTEKWSTNFQDDGTHRFTSGISGDLEFYLLDGLFADDPHIQSYYSDVETISSDSYYLPDYLSQYGFAAKILKRFDFARNDQFCDDLIQRSLDAFNTMNLEEVRCASNRFLHFNLGFVGQAYRVIENLMTPNKNIPRSCLDCHGNNSSFPIPFAPESSLIEFLKQKSDNGLSFYEDIQRRMALDASADFKMPPDSDVTAEQRSDFLEYLNSLLDSN